MGKRALFAALALIGAVALHGVASAAPEATITVGNNFLSPSSKTVSAGTRVRFRWVGGERHLIVKRRGPGVEIESRATSQRGVHLARVLDKPGTYRFVCAIHPTEMHMNVVVVR